VADTPERVRSLTVPQSDTLGTRLPIDKIIQILSLHDNGHSPHAIHLAIQSDTRTIGAVIRRYRDRARGAKALLAQSSIDMVKHWQTAVPIAAARGDHRPAKELLQAVNAIASGQGGDGAGGAKVAIQVVIGTPDSPIGYDPVK